MASSFAGFDISVLGDKKVAKKLTGLPPKVQKKIMPKAMRASMKPVLQKARADAPKRTGIHRRKIKLRKAKMKAKDGLAFQVKFGVRSELGIPADAKGYYPAALEYGWVDRGGNRHAARPHIRPALENNRQRVLRKMRVEIGRGVETAVKAGGA